MIRIAQQQGQQQRQRQRRVLAPDYALRFSCIGAECEDTCCHGWRVQVDHTTYRAYRRVREPAMRNLLDGSIRRNRSTPSSHHYAEIKLDKKGFCPLLSEEGLCRIHAELGESYLSTTCAVYPRINHTVDGVSERSLTMSCPEAARLALLNPEPMDFQLVREPAAQRTNPGRTINTDDIRLVNKPERYLWDIRSFVIGLLQNRNYSVAERLVLTGLFMGKIEPLSGKDLQAIPEIVASYKASLEDGSLRESLANIPTILTLQFKLAKELLDERFRQGVSNKQYLACLGEALAGLQVTQDADVESLGARYRLAFEEYYDPFMSAREYMLEHYLVNHVFKNLFPLGPRGPFGEYVMLVVHYALIKLHLIGMAALHKGLSEELIVRLIYSFSRVIEHNPTYLHRIYALLEASNLATMPYMAILVSN